VFSLIARRRRGEALTAIAALAASCLLAVVTSFSPQASLTLALLALTYGLYRADRRAGMCAMWMVWLLTPGIRRVLGLSGYLQADPLSIAPVLITVMIAGLEVSRVAIPPLARRVLLLVIAGWAIGIPAGAASASAMIYAFTSYCAAGAAYVIGYREPRRRLGELSLWRTLAVLAPLLALYGIAQNVLPLTSWDAHWLKSIDIVTFGSPIAGKYRVFSTLNAPGIFAPVMALALLGYLASRRAGVAAAFSALVVVFALALTFVRSSWFALAVAAVAYLLFSRGRGLRRVLLALAVCIGVPIVLSPVNQAASALVKRAGSFSSLGSDTSAQARLATPAQLIPESISLPLGHGDGSAGEAAKLTSAQNLRAPDNGYLSLVYQAGLVGFVLVIAALVIALVAAFRGARGIAPDERALMLGSIVFMVAVMFSGDHFIGVTGTIMWYLLGAAAAGQPEGHLTRRGFVRDGGDGGAESQAAAPRGFAP